MKINDPHRAHFRAVFFHNVSGRKTSLSGRGAVDLVTARRMIAGRVRARTSRGFTATNAGVVTLVWQGRTDSLHGTLRYGAWIEDTDHDSGLDALGQPINDTGVDNTVFLDKPPMPERERPVPPPITRGPLMLLIHRHVARVPVDSPSRAPHYPLDANDPVQGALLSLFALAVELGLDGPYDFCDFHPGCIGDCHTPL